MIKQKDRNKVLAAAVAKIIFKKITARVRTHIN